MIDFTANMYRRLCETLVAGSYCSVPMGDYPKSMPENDRRRVILRHDVDRFPSTAVVLAEIEHSLGLTATYFFRCVKGAFKPSVIAQVRDLGMEIGYHYECLDRADGDVDRAFSIAREDLRLLREIAPVKTMAMHGNPLTPYDNRDIWKKHDYHQLGIEVAAYFSIDYSKTPYYTDTGRNWDENKGNLYDTVTGKSDAGLSSTPALIAHLENQQSDCCISTHPHRWTNNLLLWTFNLLYDNAGNFAKLIIKKLRHGK